MNLVPPSFRQSVDKHGREDLQELRLRIGRTPELICKNQAQSIGGTVSREDLLYTINAGCKYSPWTAEGVSQGYIAAVGGHRIGICGLTAVHNSQIKDIRDPTSLCIRVARDFDGIGNCAPSKGSLLIIGRPGSGKTTLLRDLIRSRSQKVSVGVVDERGELFPTFHGQLCFPAGMRTDILTGCSKQHGIEMLLRTMGPSTIAVDEITAEEDCRALLHAGWCGVDLIATAHAGSVQDLISRQVYKPLVASGIFTRALVMQADKSWREERIVS